MGVNRFSFTIARTVNDERIAETLGINPEAVTTEVVKEYADSWKQAFLDNPEDAQVAIEKAKLTVMREV